MTINTPNFQWGGVPAREVNQFHDSSDVDSSVRAQHHTLGNGPTQAAPGDHDHDALSLKLGPTGAQVLPAPIAFYTLNLWTPFLIDTAGYEEVVAGSTYRVRQSGLYIFDLSVMFRNDFGSAGVRGSSIIIDGVQQVGNYSAPIAASADYVNSVCHTIARLAAGGQFYFQAVSGSGTSGTIHTFPYTQASVVRIGN